MKTVGRIIRTDLPGESHFYDLAPAHEAKGHEDSGDHSQHAHYSGTYRLQESGEEGTVHAFVHEH